MLETERLTVRPLQANDYIDTYEYMSVPETYHFERGNPETLEEGKKFCHEWAAKDPPNFWVAVLKTESKVIGHVSFFIHGHPDFKTWELGYIFNPKYQNKGYATEATKAVMKYAFTKLGAHRLVANCSPENIPSWKIMEKCGMRREGTQKKNFLIRNDKNGNPIWYDSYSYAILDEEFK